MVVRDRATVRALAVGAISQRTLGAALPVRVRRCARGFAVQCRKGAGLFIRRSFPAASAALFGYGDVTAAIVSRLMGRRFAGRGR